MQTVSPTWPQLVESLRHGAGLDTYVGIEIPGRQLFLSPRPWPAAFVPAGVSMYPFLAPHGTGIQEVTVELADDRTSRVGSVTCQILVITERAGAALGPTVLDILLTLEQQPATVWLLVQGGPSPQVQEKLVLLAGRITGLLLARGVLTFQVVDGAQADHRDIALSLGASVFPGSPLQSRGQALPLVFGAAYGLQPVLVEGAAQGTLATALGTTETALDLFEMTAPFPSAAQMLLGAEAVSYTGRLITAQSDGTPVLRLTGLVRSAPGPHPIGTPVLVSPVRYRSFIGFGIPALHLLAVRTADGPVTSGYTFVAQVPGLPDGAAAIDFDAAQDGLQVDVESVPPAPLPPLVNGSFETGALAPWTAAPGTTAVLRSGNASAGQYAVELRTLTPTAPGALWQDVPTTIGVRQTVQLAWQTPLGQDNLVSNGFFLAPVMAPWTATLRGSPLPYVQYTPAAADADHGQIAVHSEEMPQQGYRTLATPLSQVTIDAILQVTDVVLIPGVPHSIDVRVTAWVFHQQAVPRIVGLASGDTFQPGMGVRTDHSIVSGYGIAGGAVRLTVQLVPADGSPAMTWYLAEPSGTVVIGPVEHRIPASQQSFVPMTTTYRLVVALRAGYLGNPGPLLLTSAVISQSTLPILGQPFLQLGTPDNPTAYRDEGLAPSTNWTVGSYTFVPQAPTTRLTLRGTTALGPAAVRFDDVRFLPPGRNPVALMVAVFQRFLPHVRLDTASVERATQARQAWTFGGYVPDVGSTETLLQQLARQAACTVFKDVTGAYQIVADDPGRLPDLRLDGRRDLYASQVTLTWDDIANVYTDVYVWYQRTTQQATVSPAAQYAAVVFATPDASNSTHPELQIICSLAAGSLQVRQRLDMYADFVTEPRTADLLLQHLVHTSSTLRRKIDLGATACALPLMQTDIVQLAHPLATQGALWSGEVRRRSVVFSASAPGLTVQLSLREFGSIRGVSEIWDAPPVPRRIPRVQEPWDDLAPTRLYHESWEPAGPWFFHSDFAAQTPPVGCLYAMCGYVNGIAFAGDQQVHAVGGGPLADALSLQTQAPAWAFGNPDVSSGLWRESLVSPPAAGRGTAIYRYNTGGAEQVFVAFERQSGTSEAWTLGLSIEDSEGQLFTVPNGTQAWSMTTHNFSDGNGNALYIGTTNGQVYRWNMLDTTTLRLNEGSTRRFRALAIHPGTGQLWGACDNAALSSSGNVVMYQITALGYNSTVPGGGGNWQTCNMVAFGGQLWAAFGVLGRSEISLWSLADTGPWVKRATVPGLTNQIPGCLVDFDGTLWLGSLSSTGAGTPQIWRSDTAGLTWTIDTDFATTAAGDPNPSVTALAVARGRLYAATGMPYGASAPGARVYCYRVAEGITASIS